MPLGHLCPWVFRPEIMTVRTQIFLPNSWNRRVDRQLEDSRRSSPMTARFSRCPTSVYGDGTRRRRQRAARPRARGGRQMNAMTLWFGATAVAPELTAAWDLTPTEVGLLTTAVQFGLVVGALLSAALTLSDVIASPGTVGGLGATKRYSAPRRPRPSPPSPTGRRRPSRSGCYGRRARRRVPGGHETDIRLVTREGRARDRDTGRR